MYNLYNNHISVWKIYIQNIFWAEMILVEEISSNTLACAMSSASVLSCLFHPRFVVFLLLVPDNSGCSVYIVKMVGKKQRCVIEVYIMHLHGHEHLNIHL